MGYLDAVSVLFYLLFLRFLKTLQEHEIKKMEEEKLQVCDIDVRVNLDCPPTRWPQSPRIEVNAAHSQTRDGPDHLGLCSQNRGRAGGHSPCSNHGLTSETMALITSGCAQIRGRTGGRG